MKLENIYLMGKISAGALEHLEKAKNKNTITWEDAVTIIQTLVDERDNKITKQAWERILQG